MAIVNSNNYHDEQNKQNIIKMRQDIVQMIGEGARVPRIAEYFEKSIFLGKIRV